MASSQVFAPIRCRAAAALSLYRFVSISGPRLDAVHVSTAQGEMNGTCGESVAAGTLQVPVFGLLGGTIHMVELAEAMARGALVASDDEGKAIAWDGAAGSWSAGKLLDGGVAGDVVSLLAFRQRAEL